MAIKDEERSDVLNIINVIIIEDNTGDARLVYETLAEVEGTQFDIEWAKSLSEGIDFISKKQFDIILLDLSLPDSQGLDTINRMLEFANKVPIIVFTGHTDEKLGIETIQRGAQDYLVKGYVNKYLLSRSITYSIERKNTELEREILQKQLEQSRKMESIGRLAGGIAHDFNNILGTIIGYADLILLKFARDNEKLTKYVKTIMTVSQRAADLTANLLAFARKGKFEVTLIDMHDVINDINVLIHHAIEKHICIKLELKASETIVNGDRAQLQNALLNLIVNARDAMPDGGDLTISTETIKNKMKNPGGPVDIKSDSIFILSVKDTGVGMAEDIKTKIFDPFFTTKETGKGTGLGLSSVYGCIKNHGGEIKVESKKGSGSTFIIYLPVDDISPSKREPVHSEKNIIKGNGTILVVDDEEMLLESISEMLLNLGYKAVCYSSGEKAMEYYRKNYKQVHSVILDLIMPGMDGLGCLKIIKEINPEACVVVSSGYSEEKRKENIFQNGAKEFLKKPYNISELSKTLLKVLGK
ncbi:MAG: response regulator [Chitinispirillia bacterium]|jgi:signal transduction histidine kinase